MYVVVVIALMMMLLLWWWRWIVELVMVVVVFCSWLLLFLKIVWIRCIEGRMYDAVCRNNRRIKVPRVAVITIGSILWQTDCDIIMITGELINHITVTIVIKISIMMQPILLMIR